jgi:SAM-dependent methyltransferase
MNPDPVRAKTRQLAAEHVASGDPLGWFDKLYRQAGGQAGQIPWADRRPNPYLTEWLDQQTIAPRNALVVGCGLGDDAEFLASRGWTVEAFDISEEAIRWAKERFPRSKVRYQTVDLFHAPPHWHQKFDFVLEIYTLQAMPPDLRRRAMPIITEWVAPGGLLFAFSRGRDESEALGTVPWPLAESEIRAFEAAGLPCRSFEDFLDRQEPPLRRFRAVFARPQAL